MEIPAEERRLFLVVPKLPDQASSEDNDSVSFETRQLLRSVAADKAAEKAASPSPQVRRCLSLFSSFLLFFFLLVLL
jgi:hypothetical protein